MEYKKTGEVKKNVFGSNVTPVQGGRSFMEEQPSMMPGACPWMMPGNNSSMENQPWMMPGNRPMMEGQPMMPGNWSPMMPMMPRNQRQSMMPPYPVYPSNMVMPYYYGETMQGMEFTEEDLDKELEQVMEMYPSTAKEIQKKVIELL